MENEFNTYQAIIWTSPDSTGIRVDVFAPSLNEAKEKLEHKYGAGNVYNLHDPVEAAKPRSSVIYSIVPVECSKSIRQVLTSH